MVWLYDVERARSASHLCGPGDLAGFRFLFSMALVRGTLCLYLSICALRCGPVGLATDTRSKKGDSRNRKTETWACVYVRNVCE